MPVASIMTFLRQAGIELVRHYHRLDVRVDSPIPDRPCLIVGNHGFGGVVDLNVFALLGTLDKLGCGRPVTALTHQLAWTLQLGPLLETVGSRPANETSALAAFAAGHHVLVLPGGDIDAGKSFRDRNRVDFAGRTGFAELAIDAGVSIVPIVTVGAGETLFVLTSGQTLARRLRLDRLLRMKALPISISIPWGLNVGLVGLLPYIPLPAKMQTVVLPSMDPGVGEEPAAFASRVETAMQSTATELASRRRLFIG
jgi:1-acyl-sn-glycerol-3-phosphate acyltransferase